MPNSIPCRAAVVLLRRAQLAAPIARPGAFPPGDYLLSVNGVERSFTTR